MPSPGLLDRWDVLQLVKDSASITGIREREISILAAHLSVLPKGKLDPRRLLISYAQVSGILERANCMDERRFRRGEARLEELGFVTRKLSANARRFPVKDGKGNVVDAYGIDLAPLFARIPELQRALQRHREAEAQKRALRSRISACLSAIKRQVFANIGESSGAVTNQLSNLRNELRRRNMSLENLIRIEAEVGALAQQCRLASSEVVDQNPLEHPEQNQEMSADGGQTVRHIESTRKDIYINSDRGDDPHLAWTSCAVLPQYYPDFPVSSTAISRNLYEFLGFLGIKSSTRDAVVRTFGLADALRVADYVARRINAIARPSGYVRQMIGEYKMGNPVAGGTVLARRQAAL